MEQISKETKERIIDYLYKDLEMDTTNVEINELLDELEKPPLEVCLTDEESKFRIPGEFYNVVNEYLRDTYGWTNSGYGIEIKVSNIDWDEKED